MISDYHIIRQSAELVAQAADRVVGALREQRVQQEHQLTDRMLGQIEQAMDGYHPNHRLRWTAKTLTDKGRGSEEKIYGPDFAGVLEIALGDFLVKKGFLAQSKLLRERGVMGKPEFTRMQAQCQQMLELSPFSYVFFFSTQRIFVVPALSIVAADPCDPRRFYNKSVKSFYQEHFSCFIGDRSINSASPGMLEDLRGRLNARSVLFLEAAVSR